MDGTFSTVPEQFSQLYVVFRSGNTSEGKIFPCAYMLLPNKETLTYLHVLRILKEKTDHSPKEVYIDFEQAVVRAIRTVFPEANIFGCGFHWKKKLFSNVGDKNCLTLYNENEYFQIGLDLIYTLCMVPVKDVVLAWETVVEPYFEEHLPDNQECASYCSYVERTYIGKINPRTGDRRDPMFPIDMWNIHDRILSGKHTTNNSVESWNGRWNNTVGSNHNIFRVISGFKNEDGLARTKLQELVSGRSPEVNPSRKERKTARFEALKLSLSNYNQATLDEFMHGLRDDV